MNIEFDLKEILIRFENKLDKIETKVDKLSDDIGEVKTHLVKVEEEIKGEIKVLEATIDGISKRIDTQEFINRGVIIGLLLAVLGGFAKVFGFTS
jgi:predicted  nucleic acid-binding Zn-ribbon protein